MTADQWIAKWKKDAKMESYRQRIKDYREPEPSSGCGCGHPNARPPCSWCTSPDREFD